jgi:hypothetical protein
MTTSNLKNIIKEELSSITVECGLSRIFQHTAEHQCGILTAWRSDAFDRSLCVGKEFASEEIESFGGDKDEANKINNRNLKAFLLDKGYGVTNVGGDYIDGFEKPSAIEVGEDSMFVVNLSDSPGFFADLKKAGEKFCQDAVLLIEPGGEDCYFFGTNKGTFPGLGEKASLGRIKSDTESGFTSEARGRPFEFSDQAGMTPEERELFDSESGKREARHQSMPYNKTINDRAKASDASLLAARRTEGLETYSKLSRLQMWVVSLIAKKYFR